MITRVSTPGELKQIYIELLLNKTNLVTQISDESIVNGIAYGVAKIAQKSLKDINLIESHLFPDYAFGAHLDSIAEREGVGLRLPASKSSTYLRVVAEAGTVYPSATTVFSGNGVNFSMVGGDVTIGAEGYAYISVQSQVTGTKANVQSLTINNVSPTPVGHLFVTNEYQAIGGRLEEDDISFRIRIKESHNILSKDTLSYITQVMLKFNSDVLRVQNIGTNDQNQVLLSVVTQNGITLTDDELLSLTDSIKTYLSLNDYNSLTDSSINVVLQNVEFQPIDISFRCELIDTSKADQTRKEIQIAMSKYMDFRFWKFGKKVEWDNLLQITKDHSNVKYVADNYFCPQSDVEIDPTKLPRVRGFIMLDLDGNLIIDNSNVLNPIYYPTNPDFSFQQTIF